MLPLIKQLSGYGAEEWAYDSKAQYGPFHCPSCCPDAEEVAEKLGSLKVTSFVGIVPKVCMGEGGVNIYLTEDDCEDVKIRNAFTALEFSKD